MQRAPLASRLSVKDIIRYHSPAMHGQKGTQQCMTHVHFTCSFPVSPVSKTQPNIIIIIIIIIIINGKGHPRRDHEGPEGE